MQSLLPQKLYISLALEDKHLSVLQVAYMSLRND